MTKEDIKRQQLNMLKKLVVHFGELVTNKSAWPISWKAQNGIKISHLG